MISHWVTLELECGSPTCKGKKKGRARTLVEAFGLRTTTCYIRPTLEQCWGIAHAQGWFMYGEDVRCPACGETRRHR